MSGFGLFKSKKRANILVLNIDFDGCTDTPESRERLIYALVEYLKDNPQYTKIAIACGSLRQSLHLDYLNALGNQDEHDGQRLSCSVLLNEFYENLRAKIDESFDNKITTDRIELFMSDLLDDCSIGNTLKHLESEEYQKLLAGDTNSDTRILRIQGGDSRWVSSYSDDAFDEWYDNLQIKYSEEGDLNRYLVKWDLDSEDLDNYVSWRRNKRDIGIITTNNKGRPVTLLEANPHTQQQSPGNSTPVKDVSKISQMYALSHYIYDKYQKPFDLLHLDDRDDILKNMCKFSSSNSESLPLGTTYGFVNWNSDDSTSIELSKLMLCRGKGKANPDYKTNFLNFDKAFYEVSKDRIRNGNRESLSFQDIQDIAKSSLCPTEAQTTAKLSVLLPEVTTATIGLFQNEIQIKAKKDLSPDSIPELNSPDKYLGAS